MRVDVVRSTATLALLRMSLATCYTPGFAEERAQLLRDRSEERRTTLLVIGIKHFDPLLDDLHSGARQAQIDAVVERLSAMRPTHVVMEWPEGQQSNLDCLYSRFQTGEHEPGRSELEQLGLRLAARCRLPRVHGLGWDEPSPSPALQCDWDNYGVSHGQAERVEAILEPAPVSAAMSAAGQRDISDWLRTLNDKAALAEAHRFFFDIATVGDQASQPGANYVAQWYARNLRIFAGITRLAPLAEDRVVVLYGSDHAYLLRQFARESGAYRVLDVQDVLC